ncbi:MAG: hypothetical protein GDA36_05385 [Rhodobacteraceae bacterium]|nr:hypothetical protein [Paracoccaceae bacterium]
MKDRITGTTGTGQTDKPRRRHPLRYAIVWSVIAFVLGTAAVAAVFVLLGRSIKAPYWLLDRIETRLETSLNGLDLTFENLQFVVDKSWHPRARLENVVLTGTDGTAVARLAKAEASLALRPLLQGRVHPRDIVLNGGFAVLRREQNGNVSLQLSEREAPVQEATGVLALLDGLEHLLHTSMLSDLTEISMFGMTLQYDDAQSGRSWLADGGNARLIRDEHSMRLTVNSAVLGGEADMARVELNYEGWFDTRAVTFGVSVTGLPADAIASQFPALAWLSVLQAPISGSMRGSTDADGTLGPLNASLHIGAGALQPTDRTRPIPFQSARSYFEFNPATETLRFDDLAVTSDWITGEATGKAQLFGLSGGKLEQLVMTVDVKQLLANPAGIYPEPLTFAGIRADMRMRLDPFQLDLGQMHVELDNTNVLVSSTLATVPEGWDVSVDALVDAITPEALVSFWSPDVLPKLRAWVDRNLIGGRLEQTRVAVRGHPGAKPDIYLNFEFFDSTLRFMNALPPITGATGRAMLFDRRFVVTATDGIITAPEGGTVDIAGTSVIIPDVGIRRRTPGVVRARLSGGITALLSLLNLPPLRIFRDVNLPVSVADGTVRTSGTLSLPLAEQVQFPEVAFLLNGTVEQVWSDVLVPGHTVASDRLTLTATDSYVALNGDGKISGIPATVSWRQEIGPNATADGVIQGSLELSRQALNTFNIGLPDAAVSGTGSVDYVLHLPKGAPPNLQLASDLVGLTLTKPELGWHKPASVSGALAVSARLGPAPEVDALSISVPGAVMQGRVTLVPGGGLDRMRIDTLKIGNWIDVHGELVGRGPGRGPDVQVQGGEIVLHQSTFQPGPPPDVPPGGLRVSLDRVEITEHWALTDVQGAFELNGGLSGPFVGQLNGQVEVKGEVLPENGRSAFRIRSSDAGAVFRATNILNEAQGGELNVVMRPVEGAGTYDGTLTIDRISIKNAPAIAALLNAISITGLLDELAGQGIVFSRVEARFRLDPKQLTIFESHAVGPSIGLTMDGRFNIQDAILNTQGVISPVYLLNSIGQIISRQGEGLFGFNYRLNGPAAQPSISVNPMSVLVPGFLRDIFRSEARPRDPNVARSPDYSPPKPEER